MAIVSEAFARAYFPGEEALGRTVGIYTGESASIVGVVKDHTYRNRGRAPEPVLYRAFAQIPNMSTQPRPLIIHVQTIRPADESLAVIRRAMTEFDPDGPAFVEPLREATNQEIVLRKILGFLLSSVGALGLLLATIGLYGVMAHVVTSRTAEIAIQMALGASSDHVLLGGARTRPEARADRDRDRNRGRACRHETSRRDVVGIESKRSSCIRGHCGRADDGRPCRELCSSAAGDPRRSHEGVETAMNQDTCVVGVIRRRVLCHFPADQRVRDSRRARRREV